MTITDGRPLIAESMKRICESPAVAHERRAQLAQALGVTVETLEGAMAMLEERQWRQKAAEVAERMRVERD